MGWENATGMGNFVEVMQYVNRTTNEMFGLTLLFVVFTITLLSLKSKDYSIMKALTASGYLICIIGTYLVYLEILSQAVLLLCVIITAIATVSLLWEKEV